MKVIRPPTGPVRLSAIPEHIVFTCAELLGANGREKGGAMIIVRREIFRLENDLFHVYKIEEKKVIMIRDWEVVALEVWPNAALTLVPAASE